MDPLSITVSTIAITGALWTTGKGIASLRKIRHGPEDLAGLLSEIGDLHDNLLQISSVVDNFRLEPLSLEDPYHCRQTVQWINEQIKNADDAMIELDRLGQICSKTASSGQVVCSRRKWQQNRSKAATLLSDVQAIRKKLLSNLTILTLSSNMRLESFTREAMYSHQQASQVLSGLVGQLRVQDSPIRRVLSGSESMIETDSSEVGNPTAGPVIQPTNSQSAVDEAEAEQAERSLVEAKPLQDFHFAKDSQPAYNGKQCSTWCSCACHSRMNFSMPSPFGVISGSFSGLSWLIHRWLIRRCAENACKCPPGPSGSIAYRFWGQLTAITIRSSPICGPEINIRFPRVVSPSHLYRFALHGDTKKVQSLFTEGTASPWDVNERGSSVLYFAAISTNTGLCRFLVEQGADPLFENQYHTSPISLAWERILSNEVKPDIAAEFAASFGRVDYISTLQFTILHKTVLGLVPLPLGPLLDCSTSGINVQDREGRTGLLWATIRDDTNSSSLLLEHGAEVNKANNRGFSPIHFTKSLPSLRLLLDKKADIMSKTEVGATPLHFASRYGRHDLIEPMVKAHADPNASDAEDTPLICSTCDHQFESTERLLSLGASPDLAAKKSGLTALHVAINENQHEIVKQLLSHNADYTLKAEKQRSILHLAAIHGDDKTMRILSQAKLVGSDAEARDAVNKTARDYFEERCAQSVPDSLKDAFERLITSIPGQVSPQDDEESLHDEFYEAVEDL